MNTHNPYMIDVSYYGYRRDSDTFAEARLENLRASLKVVKYLDTLATVKTDEEFIKILVSREMRMLLSIEETVGKYAVDNNKYYVESAVFWLNVIKTVRAIHRKAKWL